MPGMNINNAVSSDMTNNVKDVTVNPMNTDGANGSDEIVWQNTEFSKQWGYFNTIPELKSALLMKAIWLCGKGYKCDARTKVILDHINGIGIDTFDDILFNMVVISLLSGDSYAEIIRDEKTNIILNLKPLDPASIRVIYNKKGIIKRYEQISKISGEIIKFQPKDIFHLCNQRMADNIHGLSVITSLEKTILAEYESFTDMKALMHRQARPMILWKLKTDDTAKINAFVAKIDAARNLGEDMFVPDDEDIVSMEIIQVNPSNILMEWRNNVNNKFYRALGLPLILFGSSGSTESGGKMEYLAHEQVFEHDQKFLENQIWNQLNLKIDLNPPTSLLADLNRDTSKDGIMQQMNIQPNDLTAGRGR